MPSVIVLPARRAYDHAAERLGVAVGDAVLVAVHPWDVDGAARAGRRTAWINRTGVGFPPYFTTPDHTVTGVTELPDALEG